MTLESRNCGEEFSAEVLRLRVENVDLRDAYEGLLPKIDQCRRRIESLEKDKLDLSDQVLAVEEEKLKLSKMLVEMQIDNNKLKEECEASKFELNNRIMQLENENMEARMTTENHMRTIETLNIRNVELETELRDVTHEYTILKKNYTSLVKAYEDELAHSDEISTELLNLASTKAELIRNIDILSQQVDARNPEADLKHARVIINRRPPTRIKVSDLPIREQGDRNQCSTIEKRYKAEMDRQRQTYLDNERVLEAKIDNLRKELDEARDATRAKYTALAELNARVLTLTDQKNTLESQNNRMQHKLKAINEDFRARLVKFVEDAALFIDRQKVGDLEGSRKKMEEYVNEMLGELKHAYHVREEQLSSVAQDCRAQMRVIIRKHEALIAAYRELKLQVVGLGIHDINLGPDETELMLTETELHSVQQREINRLREDLNQSEMEREELQIQTMSVKKRMTMPSDNNINNSVEATSPQSWAVLQKQLKEFTLNTQQELETERAGLLSRNAMLEQEVTELNDYINTDLNRYKNEIARLQGLLVSPGGKKLRTQP
ncbi:Coiled-coil domain-containing protein 78 [Lamellibrachia satsuma]|nr:Coiled-coil domain-containing protein 78 [Lamellibrachia satsuma]